MSSMENYSLANFGRIDLKPAEFDRTIYQKGARILWEKSCLCSCLDVNTVQPDYNCPGCFGKGYVYFDPREIRGVVSGINGGREQIPIGLMDVGTSFVTTRAQDAVGFRDRMTFIDFRTPYSQVVEYTGDPAGVPLKYACMDLVSVRVLNSEIPLTSITLSENKRNLLIDPSLGFQIGERFSLLYHIQPAYIVIDLPHELRGTFVKFGNPEEVWTVLPRQLLVKREDLMPLQRGQVL